MPAKNISSRIGHVRINGAVFYAFHGVSESERQIGAQYQIDVDVTADIAQAATSDKLSDAVNYQEIYTRVQNILTEKKYQLMESIVSRIVDEIFSGFPPALEVAVAIRKLNAPLNGVVESAEITIALARGEWSPLH